MDARKWHSSIVRRVSFLQDHHQGIHIYVHTSILREINTVYIRSHNAYYC
jgi:hypothetical protein